MEFFDKQVNRLLKIRVGKDLFDPPRLINWLTLLGIKEGCFVSTRAHILILLFQGGSDGNVRGGSYEQAIIFLHDLHAYSTSKPACPAGRFNILLFDILRFNFQVINSMHKLQQPHSQSSFLFQHIETLPEFLQMDKLCQ